MKRHAVVALAPALLLVACTSTAKLTLDSGEVKELVESKVAAGMSRREVRDILGEPTLRRFQVSGGAEWVPSSSVGQIYSECWYWGRRPDAVVCFGPVGREGGVAYTYAAGDSASR